MAKQLKAIPAGRNEWLVIEFYVDPRLGECHTNYRKVIALSADEAIAWVKA